MVTSQRPFEDLTSSWIPDSPLTGTCQGDVRQQSSNVEGGTITELIQKGFQVRKHFLFFKSPPFFPFVFTIQIIQLLIHILSMQGPLKTIWTELQNTPNSQQWSLQVLRCHFPAVNCEPKKRNRDCSELGVLSTRYTTEDP